MRKNLWMLGAGLLLCAMPAFAADAPAVVADDTKAEAPKVATEDPSPLLPAPPAMPKDWIILDLRPPAFSFNPNFITPEIPTPIIPKGWGVKIIMPYVPEPDSECSAAQNRACGKACGKTGKTMVACDLDITWNPDGTATRTLVCTCALAGPQDPRIAGSHVDTFEIRIPDVPEVPDTP